MSKKLNGLISLVSMSVFSAFLPSIASASEIALTFELNGLTITGEFVGFQENAYIVDTTVGQLTIAADLVSDCEGADCIDFSASPELTN